MNPQRRRAVAAAALMLGGAGAAAWAKPRRQLADEIGIPDLPSLFPKRFGNWREDTSIPVILPSPDVQALLDRIYNQVLARTYVNAEGQRIMLSVAYGGDQSDGTSAHRPEVCYPAQGFAITANDASTLTLEEGKRIPVRRLMSRLGGRAEPITYWIVVGGEVVTSGIGQKLAQLRYGVRGVIADGMLVRVSSIDPEPDRAFAVHDRFVTDLLHTLDGPQRARVAGQ